jgi:DNA polymerase-3 subunit delta'
VVTSSLAPFPWPDALAGTPVVAVIEQAIARGRLSHSLLLAGDDIDLLRGVGLALADRLLNPPSIDPARRRRVEGHPDCFHLRTKGKARDIIIGDPNDRKKYEGSMREFIEQKLPFTASVGSHKVGIVHEADRMNIQSANAFLKTLEEPPANTTLILLTTRPHALLPTIRSRCQLFRFPAPGSVTAIDGWSAWLDDYRAWLGGLHQGTARTAPADAIFALYGLVARFDLLLENAVGTLWNAQKKTLPEDLSSEEQEAIETGLSKGLRDRLFADVERATSTFARSVLSGTDAGAAARAFAETIKHLEHAVGLLRVNFSDAAALELFLLKTLRAWTRK